MASDFARIINDYRERCDHLLQDARPDSAESYAASQMISAFEQDQGSPADTRAMRIAAALANYSRSLAALPMAPPEKHAMAREARAIARKWALDFIRDTGQQPKIYGL